MPLACTAFFSYKCFSVQLVSAPAYSAGLIEKDGGPCGVRGPRSHSLGPRRGESQVSHEGVFAGGGGGERRGGAGPRRCLECVEGGEGDEGAGL